MADSLLTRLLAAASSRLRSNGNAYISGDTTLQQGTNVSLSQLGSVITIDASLAALTRLRANAASYLSGDVTLAEGTNITLTQVGSTITFDATGGGGSALPSPYTATIETYDGIADSLVITGPSGSYPYPGPTPPTVVLRGRDNTDIATDSSGGDVAVAAGDLPAGTVGANGGGIAHVRGGNGPIPGSAWITGGLTLVDGGTAGSAVLFGRQGSDHASLTNVIGGQAAVYGGEGKGTGDGGGVLLAAGYSYTGHGGLLQATGGASGTTSDGGNAYWRAGDSAGGSGGAAECLGGAGLIAGGPVSVQGGIGVTDGDGGSCLVAGGAAAGAGAGGTLSLSGGDGRQPGDVRIAGGGHTTGTDEAGGSVYVRGGEGNANYGGAVSISGGEGDAGAGGDLELFVGLDALGTLNNGVLRFGVGGAEATPTVTKDYSTTHLTESSTANATPAQHFTTTVPDHCVYTIVSVSHARTTSASDGGTVGRRSTWRRNGASATQIGVTKSLTDADEDNGFSVTHTPDTAAVDVNAVGKAATTVYWRHTVQVLMHSVGS